MNVEPEQPTRKGGEANSTGDVHVDVIASRKPDPPRFVATRVRFTPAARTRWHSHAVGQTLHILEGTADGDGPTRLEPVAESDYRRP